MCQMDAIVPPLSRIETLSSQYYGKTVSSPLCRKALNIVVVELSKEFENRFRETKNVPNISFECENNKVFERIPADFLPWIALSIENVAKKFFSFNDQLFQELDTKGLDAIRVKLKRKEFSSLSKFIDYWANNRERFLTDIIGTLLLGPTASVTVLHELLATAQSDENFSETFKNFLRLKISTRVLDFLNLDERELSSWKEDINQQAQKVIPLETSLITLKINDQTVEFDAKKAESLAEFIAYHLIMSDVDSLEGKSLKDLFSTNDQTLSLDQWVESYLLHTQKIEHTPSLTASSILSGTLKASLENPDAAYQYFQAMLQYLDQRSNIFIPELGSPRKAENFQSLVEFLNHFPIIRAEIEQKTQEGLNIQEIISSFTYLNLSGLNLGTLPENFYLLLNLHTLDISTNKFKNIPAVIGKLSQLKVLRANGNELTSIPDFIAQMPQLNRLIVLENPIKEIPRNLNNIVWELPFQACWTD